MSHQLETQSTHDFIGFCIALVFVLWAGYLVLEVLGVFDEEEDYRW